mmetsp:Transcript_3420/g.7476  ORF Transcript_3420/g.7476 Transcript_3420/m.7476 type:complete len:140 (+) Transcript_3420:350-769(+)
MNDRLSDLAAKEEGDDFDLEVGGAAVEKKSDWVVVSRVAKKTKKKRKKSKSDAHSNQSATATPQTTVIPKEDMDRFYRDIAAVGACIDAIQVATGLLAEINDEAFVTTGTKGEQHPVSQEFTSLIAKTNKQAITAKKIR